jgi:hypothetical protein
MAVVSLVNCLPSLRGGVARTAGSRWGVGEDYDRFLEHIRRTTVSGDSIVILAPAHRETPDYDYAFFRASYVLAGRTVLPAVQNDRLVMANVDAADFAAVWRGHAGLKGRLLWREGAGELWHR